MGNISELFWLFFIFSFLQPVIRQKLLNLKRMKVLTALEKKRGTRVISLIHRQETMALLGFPVMRYIDIQDSITVEEAQSLGLPVATTMPAEIHQFMSLFPQPTRTRPGVEYIPVPYRGRPGSSGH